MKKNQFGIEKTGDIKTWMMLMVVLYHSINLWSSEGWHGTAVFPSPMLAFCASWLNGFMVQTFAFVSAYIYAFLRDDGKYVDKRKYIRSRAERLLMPFYFFSLLWAVPFFIALEGGQVGGIFKSYVLAVKPDQLWFLWMLFLLSTLFCLLEDKIKRINPIVLILLFCIVYPAGLFGQSKGWNFFQFFSSIRYLVYFYFGLVFERRELAFIKKVPGFVWFVLYTGISLFRYYVLGVVYESSIIRVFSSLLTPFISLCGIMMVISLLSQIDFNKMCSPIKRVYEVLKKYSFTIYLFHMQIVLVLNKWLNGKCSIPVHVACDFIAAILLSVLLSMAIAKIGFARRILAIKET